MNDNRDNVFRAVIVGDVHSMGHSPKNRKDFYPDALSDKLLEVVNLCNRINADALFFTGDFFHSPEVAFTTVARYGRILMKAMCARYSILGNHDIHGGNIDTYLRCGIGLLEWFNILKIIPNDEPIFFEKGNNKIQITGQSYHYDIDKRDPILDYCRKKENGATHLFHFAHGYLHDKRLPFRHTLVNDIKNHTEADITFTGHLHFPYFVQTEDGKIFTNPGALGRITASKSEMRMPYVYILTVEENGEIHLDTYVIQTAKNPDEVLDRSKLDEEDIEFYKMNAFLTSIQNVISVQVLDFEEIINRIAEEQQIDDEVRRDTLNEIAIAKEEIGFFDEEGGEI